MTTPRPAHPQIPSPPSRAVIGFVNKFDVSTLFDRRFEHLASAAVPATYRS